GDFILKTYVRRNKTDSFKTLKGNPIGFNMLSSSKKLSENTQNTPLCSGTVVHGRRFHHAHAQIPAVKTAAQSNQDRKERKEYPPHVQKVEINPVRLSRFQGVVILSSDDDDDDMTNRRERISPQPADSACSSPAPSTGKVEAALNANTFRTDNELRSNLAESELNTVTLPRKARMKDQFGNSISTPLKRRKVNAHETLVSPVSLNCQNSYESVILNCRSIRVGTLFRLLVEPVIFSLDLIKIHLDGPESDPVEIILNTSDLTKCEWCNVRKLPVVFLQAIPAVY
uniref:SUMO/sentrin specific peptidase 6 n=1 Tax=Nannospalax galili TaxID=1026970 RepID=A0A8C6QUB5_NANGA